MKAKAKTKVKKRLTEPKRLALNADSMMSDYTSSNLVHTPKQRREMIQARRLVAREEGSAHEKEIPWGLEITIFHDEEKSGKVISDKEIKDTHKSRTVQRYKKPDAKKKTKSAAKKRARKSNSGARVRTEKRVSYG